MSFLFWLCLYSGYVNTCHFLPLEMKCLKIPDWPWSSGTCSLWRFSGCMNAKSKFHAPSFSHSSEWIVMTHMCNTMIPQRLGTPQQSDFLFGPKTLSISLCFAPNVKIIAKTDHRSRRWISVHLIDESTPSALLKF